MVKGDLSLLDESSAVLDASRTLRAGYAGADGILESVCARRSAGRQVRTKEWSLRPNKGMGFTLLG